MVLIQAYVVASSKPNETLDDVISCRPILLFGVFINFPKRLFRLCRNNNQPAQTI